MDFDFSLMKNNYIRRISENFNVQFRAEFFNILNRANFAAPVDNSTLFDETGAPIGGAGAIDSDIDNVARDPVWAETDLVIGNVPDSLTGARSSEGMKSSERGRRNRGKGSIHLTQASTIVVVSQRADLG